MLLFYLSWKQKCDDGQRAIRALTHVPLLLPALWKRFALPLKLYTHCLSWTHVKGQRGSNNGSWWKFAKVINQQKEKRPYQSTQPCQMPDICFCIPSTLHLAILSSSVPTPRQARGLLLGRVHRLLIPSAFITDAGLLSPAEQHIQL